MTAPTPAAQEARDTAHVGALLDLWDASGASLPDHREAWAHLLGEARREEERRQAEPNGGRIPPWERPKRDRDKPKRFIVGRFIAAPPPADDPTADSTQIERYEEYDPESGETWACDFAGDAGVGEWAPHCANWRRCGRPVILLQSGHGFNLMLLDLTPSVTAMGYRVRIVPSRSGVCTVTIQKGHSSWPFWSIERCTGQDDWRRHVDGAFTAAGISYAALAARQSRDRERGYQTLPGSPTTATATLRTSAPPSRAGRARGAAPGMVGEHRRRVRTGTGGGDPDHRPGMVDAGITGSTPERTPGVPTDGSGAELCAVSAWLSEVQDLLLARFGVSLRATIASAALGAAARRLPHDWRLWRPPALLDSVCRAGGAYRGGWVYARRYRANTHKPLIAVDVRRLYAWALTQPLPLAAGLALGEDAAEIAAGESGEREGIWLCTITNTLAGELTTTLPVSLAVWSPPRGDWPGGFQKTLWRGKTCLALLHSGEIPGLRALGYGVAPGVGYWFTETFDLRSYVAEFQKIIDQYGAKSWQSGITKQLGNCLSGKWGAGQQVIDVCYSETVPSSTEAENARGEFWYPMIDQHGVEVDGCWERRKRWVAPSQQPHLAAAVTAHGRGKTYTAAAMLRASGGEVYYVDTDGILTTADPVAAGLDLSGDTQIGAWRMGGWDERAEVAGPRMYQADGDVIFAGSNAPEPARRAAIALLVEGRSAQLDVRVVRRPWSTGAGGDTSRSFKPGILGG